MKLTGLEELADEESLFHTIQCKDESNEKLVNRSFTIHALKNIIDDPEEELEFSIRFEPYRPFKGIVELLIYKATGGRWKFNMLLDARPPDIDDTIKIECELNRTSIVSFNLCNQFKAYAEFDAWLTAESDKAFTLNPKHGTLEPFGRDGTKFVI